MTSTLDGVRVEPAYLWVPETAVGSSALEAASFGEQIGMVPDPDQMVALGALMSENAAGDWAAFESALAAARQNIKTFLFRLIVMFGTWVLDTELTVWTAHQFPVAMEAFRDIRTVAENYDHLRRRVKKVSEANGDEHIELLGGQRIQFKARTKTGGRGLTAPRIVLDEAQELTASIMGSLMPTMSAVPNPQLLYGGSAGKVQSHIWRALRNRGRAGGDPSLVWVEYCAPVTRCVSDRCDHLPMTLGCALDNEALWSPANPAIDRRIPRTHIAAERRSMPPEEFARERLGWWDEPDAAIGGIPADVWEQRRVDASGDGVVWAYAVDVTPDSKYAALARAIPTKSGFVVEVVKHDRGTDWVVGELVELLGAEPCTVVVDKSGPASVVVPDIEKAGIEPIYPTGQEIGQACAMFIDGLSRGSVVHVGQTDLDAAARGAVRAPAGDGGWKWSRKSSAIDISPLVAVTFAAWAAQLPDAEEPDDSEPFVIVT